MEVLRECIRALSYAALIEKYAVVIKGRKIPESVIFCSIVSPMILMTILTSTVCITNGGNGLRSISSALYILLGLISADLIYIFLWWKKALISELIEDMQTVVKQSTILQDNIFQK